MAYTGNVPATQYTSTVKDTFNGDGTTTDFTLSRPSLVNNLEVFVENVQQEPTTAYTVSGTTLSFTSAPVSGTGNIYVIHRGPAVQQVVPPAGVVIDASSITTTGSATIGDGLTTTGSATIGDGLTVDNDGATVATFDRATSNGTIVDLQKDGTAVGSIGTYDTDIHIGSGDVGLSFYEAGQTVLPFNPSTPVYRDNAIGLGNSSNRFTDLYLSGGVYLGGTGAVNKLEDYEEGTWTPTYNASGTSPSVTYSTRQARYRKIGNMVVVSWHLRASAYTAGSGDLQITGLPFAASSEASMGNFGTINFEQLNFSTGRTMAVGFIAQSQDYIFFQEQGDSIDVRTLQSADLTGGIRMIRGTITYFTDS